MKKKISKITFFFINILLLLGAKVQAVVEPKPYPTYGVDLVEPVDKVGFLERFLNLSWILVPICWIVGLAIYYKRQNKKMKYIIAFTNIVVCIIVTYVVYCVVS